MFPNEIANNFQIHFTLFRLFQRDSRNNVYDDSSDAFKNKIAMTVLISLKIHLISSLRRRFTPSSVRSHSTMTK